MLRSRVQVAKIRSWHVTDVGMVRDHNEDNGYADPGGRFFICSDGMGGHAAGDIASRMAVEEISTRLDAWPAEIARCAELQDGDAAHAALKVIEAAVRATNESIHRRGRTERDKRGMGCTVDVVVACGSMALCAHVGDSRNYLIRDGQTRQLTQDHSLAPPRQPGQAQQKGMLTSALGPNPTCRVDTFVVELREGDRILLCTDGLADYFPDEREIGATVTQRGDDSGVQWLVDQAKARGGADNITIVMFKVDAFQRELPVASFSPPPAAGAREIRSVSYARPDATPVPGAAAAPEPSIGRMGVSRMGVIDDKAPPVSASVPRPNAAPAPKAAEPPPEIPANRMGAFTTSPLFSGVSAEHIARVVGGGQPQTLPAGKPVPRVVNSLDTAWLILDGEFRGLLLYPEALIAGQGDWKHLDTPDDATQAMPIQRLEFNKFCMAEPAAGVKLLTNVARLMAADLKERQPK
jgi:serine/threonine protein phosphatase PrpC